MNYKVQKKYHTLEDVQEGDIFIVTFYGSIGKSEVLYKRLEYVTSIDKTEETFYAEWIEDIFIDSLTWEYDNDSQGWVIDRYTLDDYDFEKVGHIDTHPEYLI